MESMENFGPNDVENGTLAAMFRRAGVSDVPSYVEQTRNESNEIVSPSEKRNLAKSAMNNAKDVYRLFKSLDKNGDGKITVVDVEMILKEMGLGFVSKHLAAAIFELVDTNHNGRLELRDLIALTTILKRLSASKT